MQNNPTPKQQAPELTIPLLDGTLWDLRKSTAANFTLVVFYRGLHCPLCKKYLNQLKELREEFKQQGVEVIAISMDSEKRARLSRQKWELDQLPLGYNLAEETARNWGLYLSAGIKEGEPEIFSEPGLFLVDNQSQIYYAAINSNPGVGLTYQHSLKVNYIVKNNYPARGEML